LRKLKIVKKVRQKKREIKRKLKIFNMNIEKGLKLEKILKEPKRFINKLKASDNKLNIILKTILNTRIFIAILVLTLTLKALLFYQNIGANIGAPNYTMQVTISFLLVMVIPLMFIKKNKNRFRWIMAYDIFFSILLFADNAYWKYQTNMLSVSQIFYLKYAEEIGGALPNLMSMSYILYFIDIPIILIIYFIIKRNLKNKKTKYSKNMGKRKIVLGIFYTIIILLITRYPRKVAMFGMKDYPYKKMIQVERGSIYGYHYLDIINAISENGKTVYNEYKDMMADYNKLDTYKNNHFEEEEEMKGIAKGKNVIIVQLESVQNFVAHAEINGKEITPNLNKFLDENIELENMIVQSYSTTADSEYSAITSLYPTDNGQAFSIYSANINNDIFNIYRNAGYKTYFMHGNDKEFWNRNAVYTNLNVEKRMFLEEFEDTSEFISRLFVR
jgi:lipoteichoic acid synthase